MTKHGVKSKTPTKKGIKKRKLEKNQSKEFTLNLCVEDNSLNLYDNIFKTDIAVQELVKDWIQLYTSKEQIEAIYQVLGVIVKCAGSSIVVSKESIQGELKIDTVLEELQDKIEAGEEDNEFPYGSKSKEKKHIKKRLIEFFKQLFKLGLYDVISDMSFLSLLMNWLIGMSSCNYRPFRITATSLALNIMSFLSEGCSEIEHNKNNAIKQMKKKKSNLGEKKKQMEKQSELEEQLNQFEAILELFFDKVFEPRYRDIDNNIRAECASELASFTLKYPTYFLNNEHLKYLGWLLSDKASNVRNEALAGISIILKKEGISTFIQQFISNYKERILEMGLKEIELNVKCSAIKLIYKLHQNGLLDEDEKKKMINVLFSKEEKVQKSIAPFIKYVIIEEMIPEISKDVLETNKGKLKENEINQLGVKCLLQILLDSKLDFLNHNENGLLDIIDGFSLASKVTQNNMITTIVTALWDQLEFIKDWKTLIELSGQQNKQNRKRGIKLNEKEDILLLKIMQVAFKLLLEESKLNDINQEKLEKKSIEIHPFINLKDYLLQEARPFDALINKYFSNDEAIISVLKLIEITLNGELFLDAGKMKSYEHLLLQINKLFLTHSDTLVLYQITLSLKSLATFDTIPPQEFQSFIEKLFDDIADKIVLYKNDAENILPELQRLRVLFILNDWGINLIYYKKTEILEIFIQLIELGDQNQIDINLKNSIACLDIKYRIYLWLCKSTIDNQLTETGSDKELNNLRRELLGHLLDILQFDEQFKQENRNYFHVKRFSFVMICDIAWLDTQTPIFQQSISLLPSSLTLQENCKLFTSNITKEWDEALLKQYEEGLAENEHPFILKQTSLRESYVQIIISMLRTALLNVYPIELMINIIQNFGLMDPIIDESVKLIFYQNLKEKIKRTKEIKVFESTLKFMEDVVYESYKKSMVDEDKFHGTLSLTKLIATTLRNIGKHTTLTSKNVAKTHQVFIREVIKVMKGENKDKEGEVEGVEGENKTKEDLEKLKLKVLKTYRLLSLVVKSILVPLHARELMKQTKTSMEIYNPKESIPDWLPYFNYIKVLDEAAGPIREKEQVDEGEQSKLSAVEGPTTRVLEQTPGNTTQLLDTIFESEEVGDVE